MPTVRVSDRFVHSSPVFTGTRNRLLATLPPDDYERVALQMKTVPMAFGHVLHKQGEHIRNVYFPGGGTCVLTKVLGDGDRTQIATIGNEGAIGSSVFFGDTESVVEAVVQIDGGDGYMMPVDIFLGEMERRGAFYNRVIRYHQALMTQVMQTTVCNGVHSAEERCCRWLLMTHDRIGRNTLPLTHQVLARMLGVRRPTVTLVAASLRQSGLIDHRRGAFIIIDRAGLEKTACECYATLQANFNRLIPEIGIR